MRVDFTTREVPAVSLEVIERRVAAFEIFHMQLA